MKRIKLNDWASLKDKFDQYILVGNGASIAIDDRLSYRSLYDRVCKTNRLDDELVKMFQEFGTTNFEFMMKLLLEANRVNKSLNIKDDKTRTYYDQLKGVLISTIREIHPPQSTVKPVLPKIADFLSGFDTVLSLNYDLLIYWAMLVGNEKYKCQWFKDCFLDGQFEKDFRYLYEPRPPAAGVTLVFYPHGSLFLAKDIYGDEVKLSRGEDGGLIETVLSKWEEKDYIPLFVSEGTTSEKFHAIGRSSYLNTVYDSVLSEIKGSLVIYGWSAGEQDDHIFQALDHDSLTDIAISIHKENPYWESYCYRIEERIARTHHLKSAKLYFFDSKCEGCWIY